MLFWFLDDICFPFSVCFMVFDSDGDGFLSRSEIEVMCKALIEIRKENAGEKVIKLNWKSQNLTIISGHIR